MLRLLVVDDEPFIVNGLYEFLLLGSGLDLDVYKAFSGDEAVQWLQRTKMDIVVTDIHMPGMSGLELLNLIKQRWPHCSVIFLTGYNEFEYIYEAMQHEGVRYLLKTEGYASILELVRKAAAEIEQARNSEEMIARAARQLKLALPVMQKDLLAGLLRGERYPADRRAELFRELEIPLHANEPAYLLLGRLDRVSDADSSRALSERMYRVKLEVERYLPPAFVSFFAAMPDGGMVWVLQAGREAAEAQASENQVSENLASAEAPASAEASASAEAQPGAAGGWHRSPPDQLPQLKGMLELVQEVCEDALGFAVSFVLDGKAVPWDHISARYGSLQSWGGGLPSVGAKGSVLVYAEGGRLPPYLAKNEVLESALRQLKKLDLLGALLEKGRQEEFSQLLEEMLDSANQAAACEQHQAAAGIHHGLAVLFLAYIHSSGMSERLQAAIGDEEAFLPDQDRTGAGWSEVRIRRLAPLLFQCKANAQENRASAAVKYIQQFVTTNLQDDLSLVRLAEISNLNPSYLSRLYKQVTGVNLNAYIQEERLKQAMVLLRTTSLKVYEIAQQVGFEYAPYFTKIFKKHAHMSPQEYRDHEAEK